MVESTKAVCELFAPVTGKVIEMNEPAGVAGPETINEDPYEEGWMIVVEVLRPEGADDRPRDASLPGRGKDE